MEDHEIENLRRSVVMLAPGQPALDREQAIALFERLAEARLQLARAQHPSAGRPPAAAPGPAAVRADHRQRRGA